MQLTVILAAVVPCLGLCLGLRGGPVAPTACALLPGGNPEAGFLLGLDRELLNSSASLPGPGKRAELREALEAYREKQALFKKAEARVLRAMEQMLEVPSVDPAGLTKVLEAGGRGTLVVFYAPWCPHCQKFVLHDGHGDPSNAPLEVFHRHLSSSNETNNVDVVRYDIQEQGRSIPSAFSFQSIPSVFFVDTASKVTAFNGDPHDVLALKAFVVAQAK